MAQSANSVNLRATHPTSVNTNPTTKGGSALPAVSILEQKEAGKGEYQSIGQSPVQRINPAGTSPYTVQLTGTAQKGVPGKSFSPVPFKITHAEKSKASEDSFSTLPPQFQFRSAAEFTKAVSPIAQVDPFQLNPMPGAPKDNVEEQDRNGKIVADLEQPMPGQLTQSDFLAQLRLAVTGMASQVLGPTWSAANCPDLEKLFTRYAALSPKACEAFMQRYSGVTAEAAAGYIDPICARIRGAIARWGGGWGLSWEPGS